MTRLFKKLPDEVRKSSRIQIYASDDEYKIVIFLAWARCLSVSDFVRRVGLGRRAVVRIENEIVLALIAIIMSVRGLYAVHREQGITPPEEWRPIIAQASAAIVRISR